MQRIRSHVASALLTTALTMAISAAVVAPSMAWAKYPDKPIRLVVPFPAGGSTDVLARTIAKSMQAQLGQSVVVDNKGGAATVIGVDNVAKSANDGYTILLTTATSFAVNPHVYKKLPYKLDDFMPIGFIAESPVVMISSNKVAAKSLKELVASLKAGTEQTTVATTGKGGFSHLTAAMFFNAIGVKFTDVPYRGEAPAVQDVIAGQIPFYFGNLPGCLPYIASGRMKGYAVTSRERAPAAPTLPSFTEEGLPEVVAYAWFGLSAPKGTSAEVIQVLGDALRKATDDPEVLAQLARDGAVSHPMSPSEFGDYIKKDFERWGGVVRAANVEPIDY